MPDTDSGKSKKKRRVRRIATILAASLVGFTVAGVAATVVVYDSFFDRYERPDYSLYPGLYDYEKIRDTLPRELVSFPSGENTLQGYYYPCRSARGLVVLAHGFHAGADDYLPLIEGLVGGGYAVFTYDVTGTYSSEGDGTVGMCQSLVDLDAALTFVKRTAPYSDMPLYLIGHSWGGYAAASALALHPEVRGAALIAPMNDGYRVMLEKAAEHAGAVAYISKPVFDAYQSILFGDYVKYNGLMGVNSTDAHVLIAQGLDDTVITPDGQSIYAHRDEITNPNVSYYIGEGEQGSHTGIWHSTAAERYRMELEERISSLEERMGREMTDGERRDFYSTVDHRLYSEVNPELLARIIELYNNA